LSTIDDGLTPVNATHGRRTGLLVSEDITHDQRPESATPELFSERAIKLPSKCDASFCDTPPTPASLVTSVCSCELSADEAETKHNDAE
jgi:hypothetical protein